MLYVMRMNRPLTDASGSGTHPLVGMSWSVCMEKACHAMLFSSTGHMYG